jgi:hypothetical protein
MSPQSVPRRLSKAREPHRASESNMIHRRFKETICEVDMASPAAFGQLEGVANGPSPRQVCRDDDSHAQLLGHRPARCGLTAVISVHSLDSEVCLLRGRKKRPTDRHLGHVERTSITFLLLLLDKSEDREPLSSPTRTCRGPDAGRIG